MKIYHLCSILLFLVPIAYSVPVENGKQQEEVMTVMLHHYDLTYMHAKKIGIFEFNTETGGAMKGTQVSMRHQYHTGREGEYDTININPPNKDVFKMSYAVESLKPLPTDPSDYPTDGIDRPFAPPPKTETRLCYKLSDPDLQPLIKRCNGKIRIRSLTEGEKDKLWNLTMSLQNQSKNAPSNLDTSTPAWFKIMHKPKGEFWGIFSGQHNFDINRRTRNSYGLQVQSWNHLKRPNINAQARFLNLHLNSYEKESFVLETVPKNSPVECKKADSVLTKLIGSPCEGIAIRNMTKSDEVTGMDNL